MSSRSGQIKLALATALVLVLAPSVSAQRVIQDADWCTDRSGDRSDEQFQEAREYAVSVRDLIRVDAQPNGGIAVDGWDRNEIRLQACVSAHSRDGDPAAIAHQVTIETGSTIQARGPEPGRREGWSVSYRLMVPRSSNLDLESQNGGIHIAGVNGTMEFRTQNGGIDLTDVGGDVRGRTQNGGLDVELTGPQWSGAGLDLVTQNGGVNLTIPGGYRATLETGTVNGGFNTDFPITLRGRLRTRQITTELNGGGPTIRVMTTNGGVRIREGS